MTTSPPVADRMIIAGRRTSRLRPDGARFERASPAHDVVVGIYPEARPRPTSTAPSPRPAGRSTPAPGRACAGAERARVLLKVAELIRRDAEDSPRTEVLEMRQADQPGPRRGRGHRRPVGVRGHLARHAYGDAHNMLGQDVLGLVCNEPVGVVAMITPWNFPLLIVSQKLPFALAVGCTAVVKPSELTSGTTRAPGRLLLEAGVPAGVVNIVTGTAMASARELAAHPDVDMISFTGSTAGRQADRRSAGEQLKKV